jgi:excinuclease ABC subunit B
MADLKHMFRVESELTPKGQQSEAVDKIEIAVKRGDKFTTLLGITGSGKTATTAWAIERLQRPTLILEPNKSLAAQFASELKELMPRNKVEFFVSYYDYYQPEAYIPASDTYIEKDSSINDEINRLRHATTASLLTRRDTVVVASVSAIYALGPPEEYGKQKLILKVSDKVEPRSLSRKLIELQYSRNDIDLTTSTFRIKGDVIDIKDPYRDTVIRLSLFGDEIDSICEIDHLTGEIISSHEEIIIFPASHYVTNEETLSKGISSIEKELDERLKYFKKENKLIEAQRLENRTLNDLDTIKELGYCKGIENYSRHFDGRGPGETPWSLLDYFPKDFLVVIDESHVTVPQLHGQYEGDRSRKETLVAHGFRLPSALDNRPLKFEEFISKTNQIIFLSATPSKYERQVSREIIELIIRPTGLLDPEVEVRPAKGQVDDLIKEVEKTVENKGRVLVTTLTKKLAEDLATYFLDTKIKARYLHSNIDTIERIEILRQLRLGQFDVLVGVNLLREGLDLPEVSLVVILDADKEGFLRSSTSLIQTIGRAARNVNGRVILYADKVSDAMEYAINETKKRREAQERYNKEHNIVPETINKEIKDILSSFNATGPLQIGNSGRKKKKMAESESLDLKDMVFQDLQSLANYLRDQMHAAAKELKFELAARIRDELHSVEQELKELKIY